MGCLESISSFKRQIFRNYVVKVKNNDFVAKISLSKSFDRRSTIWSEQFEVGGREEGWKKDTHLRRNHVVWSLISIAMQGVSLDHTH